MARMLCHPVEPAGRAAVPKKSSTLRICLVGLIAGSLLVAGTYWFLNGKLRARAEARANAVVAEHVAVSHAHMLQQNWELAIEELQRATALKDATDLAEVQELLTLARQRRAAAILTAVEASLGRTPASNSFSLLDAYLADSDALEKERATEIRAELELASSDEHAIALLGQLPDDALVWFAGTGRLAELDRLRHPAIRPLYHQRLQAHLRAEQERRSELRLQEEATRLAQQGRREEALAKRAVRIRGTPVFREVVEFAERTRRQVPKSTASADEAKLRRIVVRILKITDPKQEQRLFEDPSNRPEAQRRLEAQISRMRASAKERFRGAAYYEFDAADREAFDWAVDRELDQLAAELKPR